MFFFSFAGKKKKNKFIPCLTWHKPPPDTDVESVNYMKFLREIMQLLSCLIVDDLLCLKNMSYRQCV